MTEQTERLSGTLAALKLLAEGRRQYEPILDYENARFLVEWIEATLAERDSLRSALSEVTEERDRLREEIAGVKPFLWACDKCGRRLSNETGWIGTCRPMVGDRAGHFCNERCRLDYVYPAKEEER